VKLLAAAIAAAVLCSSAAAAKGQTVQLLTAFKPAVAKLERSGVAVFLPSKLAVLDRNKIYATGYSTKKSWDLELAFAPNCGSATACYLASFQAERGGVLPGATNTHLANGDPAFFLKSGCGASCSPESLYFLHAGVLYSLQDSDLPAGSAESFMVALANSAIAAGHR
jgi:hypothetical protein